MLFCKRPFEQMYVKETYVKTCSWMDLLLGNPLENSLEDLWTNEQAEKARESIRDGSFRYCRKEECPYCASGRLEEIDDEIGKNYQPTPTPVEMNISYDKFCNHTCPSCRSSFFHPDEAYVERMKKLKEAVLPFANKAKFIITCGMGDCFASPFIMEFLQELRPENPEFHISFETNGVMLDEKHWEAISHLHQYPINFTITPNSFERYTYRYLSGGHDSLEACKRNLKFISQLRKEGKIASFRINMVVQESNYWEIPSFIHTCLEEYDPDTIQIKPLNRWFCLDAEGYWYKNVLNPLHPHHENYLKVMQDPILKHPKVWDWTEENHDRDARRHPAVYSDAFVRWFYNLLQKEDAGEYLTNKFRELEVHQLAIYGAWIYGEMCYDVISKAKGIHIEFFIDKRKGNAGSCKICRNLPIRGIWGKDLSEVDTILVTVLGSYNEIVKDLRDEGYEGKIITIKDLM